MSNKPNQATQILDALQQIATLAQTVENLLSTVNKLTEDIETLKTRKAGAAKAKSDGVRTNKNREYSDDQIRSIFKQKHIEKLSGYRIAKNMGVNSVRINSILRRDIYADVDVSDIIGTHQIAVTDNVTNPAVVTENVELTTNEIAEFAAEYDMATAEINPAIKEDWQN